MYFASLATVDVAIAKVAIGEHLFGHVFPLLSRDSILEPCSSQLPMPDRRYGYGKLGMTTMLVGAWAEEKPHVPISHGSANPISVSNHLVTAQPFGASKVRGGEQVVRSTMHHAIARASIQRFQNIDRSQRKDLGKQRPGRMAGGGCQLSTRAKGSQKGL